MTPEKRREIARKGGRAAHAKGVGHEWTSASARLAGQKGGRRSQEARRARQQEGAAA